MFTKPLCILTMVVIKMVYRTRFVYFNPFLTITGKFLAAIGTLLYVSGWRECHSKLTEEMHIPLKPIQKANTLCHWRFFKLSNQQRLADQSIWYIEGNSAELTSSGKCQVFRVRAFGIVSKTECTAPLYHMVHPHPSKGPVWLQDRMYSFLASGSPIPMRGTSLTDFKTECSASLHVVYPHP